MEEGSEKSASFATRAAWLCVALLVLYRTAYHAAFYALSPFLHCTGSDSQVYEEAARDLLAHPPLGSAPFYLQGLYAVFMAVGIALDELEGALFLQLGLAGLALVGFYWAAVRTTGPRAALASTLLLLAYPGLAFQENKFLSVSLGISLNVLAMVAFAAYRRAPTLRRALLFGLALGLATLGRPNMLLCLPFAWAAAYVLAPARGLATGARLGAALGLGFALALTPMAVRNQLVTGAPDVFPSHGGGIPFYIGHNPHADGRWNDAGGLISGRVGHERAELARRLGLTQLEGRTVERAVGDALYARGLAYVREEPLALVRRTAQKLWYLSGNDELVHHFDDLGERALLGGWVLRGLPFGFVLALGLLGLLSGPRWLARESALDPPAALAVSLFAGGQLFAVLAANLVYFTSDAHRLPSITPLAWLAGPALCALGRSLRTPPRAALAISVLIFVLAFAPRAARSTPSSVHYYNLGVAYEDCRDLPHAIDAYQHAVAASAKRPIYALRLARALRLAGDPRAALEALAALAQRKDVDPLIQAEAARERARAERALAAPVR